MTRTHMKRDRRLERRLREEGIERSEKAVVPLGDRILQYDSGALWVNVPSLAGRHLNLEEKDVLEVVLDLERGEVVFRPVEPEEDDGSDE